MGNIVLVAWDVYGTLIKSRDDDVSDCGEEELVTRKEALELLAEIKKRNIEQITISDGNLKELDRNLREAGIPREFFNNFYEMSISEMPGRWPKDMCTILNDYDIFNTPRKLLVIGDNYKIDIELAKKQGCKTIWVPEYIERKRMDLPKDRILKIIDS